MGIISAFLDLLFPPKCVFCGSILHNADDGWCDKCTEALPFADNSGRQDGEYFDFCVSPLYYRGVVRKSVLRFKFRGSVAYANVYARILADCIRESPDLRYDFISWVPLSSKHKRTRGYDQAMLLAAATALELGTAAVEVLRKPVDVRAQSELGDKAERSANISGAFTASDPELIKGKCVLLIDDVITTGSTLSECAKTLLDAGAAKVVCATLARAE